MSWEDEDYIALKKIAMSLENIASTLKEIKEEIQKCQMIK